MFYVLNGDPKIVAQCKEKREVFGTVLNTMRNQVSATVIYTSNFEAIIEAGYFFTKVENIFKLRRYYESIGYIYNSLHYEDIDVFRVIEFNNTIKSRLKPSFIDTIEKNKEIVKINRPQTPRHVSQSPEPIENASTIATRLMENLRNTKNITIDI